MKVISSLKVKNCLVWCVSTTCNVIVELLTESAKEQENEKNTMKRDKDRMDNEETMYNKAKGDKGKKDAKVKMATNTSNHQT